MATDRLDRPPRALRAPQQARVAASDQAQPKAEPRGRRFLVVDLNNFASFPTLAVGLLVAALRNRGHRVDVLCPLAHDEIGRAHV